MQLKGKMNIMKRILLTTTILVALTGTASACPYLQAEANILANIRSIGSQKCSAEGIAQVRRKLNLLSQELTLIRMMQNDKRCRAADPGEAQRILQEDNNWVQKCSTLLAQIQKQPTQQEMKQEAEEWSRRIQEKIKEEGLRQEEQDKRAKENKTEPTPKPQNEGSNQGCNTGAPGETCRRTSPQQSTNRTAPTPHQNNSVRNSAPPIIVAGRDGGSDDCPRDPRNKCHGQVISPQQLYLDAKENCDGSESCIGREKERIIQSMDTRIRDLCSTFSGEQRSECVDWYYLLGVNAGNYSHMRYMSQFPPVEWNSGSKRGPDTGNQPSPTGDRVAGGCNKGYGLKPDRSGFGRWTCQKLGGDVPPSDKRELAEEHLRRGSDAIKVAHDAKGPDLLQAIMEAEQAYRNASGFFTQAGDEENAEAALYEAARLGLVRFLEAYEAGIGYLTNNSKIGRRDCDAVYRHFRTIDTSNPQATDLRDRIKRVCEPIVGSR